MTGVSKAAIIYQIEYALIFCELFGFDNAPYAMLTCALCYILSGYYGLYTGQDILYSKFRSSYINKKTK